MFLASKHACDPVRIEPGSLPTTAQPSISSGDEDSSSCLFPTPTWIWRVFVLRPGMSLGRMRARGVAIPCCRMIPFNVRKLKPHFNKVSTKTLM